MRRPPRGVPKAQFASRDSYDVWLPNLSPSTGLVAEGLAANNDRHWAIFSRKFRAEMKLPNAAHLLDMLAALRTRPRSPWVATAPTRPAAIGRCCATCCRGAAPT